MAKKEIKKLRPSECIASLKEWNDKVTALSQTCALAVSNSKSVFQDNEAAKALYTDMERQLSELQEFIYSHD